MLDFNKKSVLNLLAEVGAWGALFCRGFLPKVALVARYQAELDETIKDIRRSGVVAYGIVADINDKGSFCPIAGTDLWGRPAGQAAALAGLVNILIHNASTLRPVPLRQIPD